MISPSCWPYCCESLFAHLDSYVFDLTAFGLDAIIHGHCQEFRNVFDVIVGKFAFGRVQEGMGHMSAMIAVGGCPGCDHPGEVTCGDGFRSGAAEAASFLSFFRGFFSTLGRQNSAGAHVADFAAGPAFADGAGGHGAGAMKSRGIAFSIGYLQTFESNRVDGMLRPVGRCQSLSSWAVELPPRQGLSAFAGLRRRELTFSALNTPPFL